MATRTYSAISLLFLFCLISCEGPTGPEGPNLTGDLVGFVTLVDQFGASLSDHSGVTVLVEETALSDRTDSSGRWIIAGLNTGTYTISFNKSGYGTSKDVGYQFVGGGRALWGECKLAPIPDFNISLNTLEAEMWGVDIMDLSGEISLIPPQDVQRELRLFVALDDSVSSEPKDYIITSLGWTQGGTQFVSEHIYLKKAGLANSSGTTLHVIVYSSSGHNYYDSGYIDPETGRFQYTNLGSIPSDVMTVVIP